MELLAFLLISGVLFAFALPIGVLVHGVIYAIPNEKLSTSPRTYNYTIDPSIAEKRFYEIEYSNFLSIKVVRYKPLDTEIETYVEDNDNYPKGVWPKNTNNDEPISMYITVVVVWLIMLFFLIN